MAKFLALYKSDLSPEEQMGNASPEEAAAGMEEWMQWFGKVDEALIDGGSPVSGPDKTIGGYTILEAESRDALDALLVGHPHTKVGTIEVYEFLAMPGM